MPFFIKKGVNNGYKTAHSITSTAQPPNEQPTIFGIMAAGPIGAYATPDTSTLEEITTTATRMPQPLDQYGGNLSVLPHEHLELVSHTHTHESFAQIAGGWTTSTLLRGIKMRSCAL